jgi:hypothetical protein
MVVLLVGVVNGGAANALLSTATPVYFSTIPPGSALPSEATCSAQVRPAIEQRADNVVANSTKVPTGGFSLTPLGPQVGYNSRTPLLEARVTGNFVGTTDEIIQWASCKWGFDENVVRAIAVTESNWHQSQAGDSTTNAALCPPTVLAPCPRSFGIHQVTWSSDPLGTYPASQISTAFNLDASLLIHRICFDGYMQWLKNIGYTSYGAGDLWGCVGQWFSGNWHDSAAQTYITKVKGYVSTKPWTQASFSNLASTTTTTTPACPCLRYRFDSGSTQGWYTGWGPLSVAATANPVHDGAGALAVKLSPSGASWPAAQVSSPPNLSSGTEVTYWVYQPSGAALTSVAPHVADLNWNDLVVSPVKLVAGWNKVSWTVPAADGIKAMGLQVNDDAGWNGQLTLDSVSW